VIISKIYLLPGKKVMLDYDLSENDAFNIDILPKQGNDSFLQNPI